TGKKQAQTPRLPTYPVIITYGNSTFPRTRLRIEAQDSPPRSLHQCFPRDDSISDLICRLPPLKPTASPDLGRNVVIQTPTALSAASCPYVNASGSLGF